MEPLKQTAFIRVRAAATRPLVCIIALMLAACGGPQQIQVPAPTPHPVDTAMPPQVRATHELVLLGTTDVHNRLYPYDYYTRREIGYGLARLKPVVDSVRAANPGRTYLFDSGDLLQGNPLGFVYARVHGAEPNPVIRAMNLLGYDAAAIGNHEFNYGLAHLDRAIAQAKFPFLSANIFKDGTQDHAYRPYALIPHVVTPGDTVLIGVTANTPPGVEVWDRQHVQGKLDFRDIVASVRATVNEMKRRGADVVVVLSHGGFGSTSYDMATTGLPPENAVKELAEQVPAIDVVFMGHTHGEVADTSINGVLITQAKNWAQSLARVDLKLERRNAGDWLVIDKSAGILKPQATRADTAFLDSLRWEHERTVAYVKSVAGRSAQQLTATDARFRDTPIIDFINEVQRKVSGAQLSAAAAFDTTAMLPAGPVTIADLAGLYVYDNTLKAIRITGTQLRQYLEKAAEYHTPGSRIPGYNFDIISGVDYTIDTTKPEGGRITRLLYQGRPVRADQEFTLALNNYRQSGGGGYTMIADAPVIYDRQEGIRELLIEELQRRGTLRAGDYFKRNWNLLPDRPAAAAPAARPQTRAQKKLRVIATNDVHGRLLPETYSWSAGRPVGGMATLAAYFDHEAAGFDGATIILDGGDVMQGTPISNLTRGRSTVRTFNAAGYSAAAIGNHEFDWGLRVLRERMRDAKFAWLAANIFIAGTNRQPAWSRPTAMITIDGVKVGLIGLATEETPHVTKGSNVEGFEFRSGSAALNRWVPELRRQGADFVIAVAHSGAVCNNTFTQCDGEIVKWARETSAKPDLIVAGHTHRMVKWIENGIPIIEAGSYTQRYGVADLTRDSATTHVWIHAFPVPFADRVTPDSSVQRIVAAAQREIGPQVNRVIATLADTLRRDGNDGPIGHLLADAWRAATGAQIAFMNNGGIRTNELPAGPVTWGMLYSLQPFENRMTRLTMTGAQIRSVLERALRGGNPDVHVSGITVVYNPSNPEGRRVERIALTDGTVVEDGKSYAVGVPDFLAGRGDGYDAFAEASRRVDIDKTDLDALIEYLQNQPQPVRRNRAERRFLITPTN